MAKKKAPAKNVYTPTGEVHIHDGNWQEFAGVNPLIDGERKARGLVPRDYATTHYPRATALDIPLIPRSEWSARIKEMEQTKSRLSDIRDTGKDGQQIPSRDQNGRGYCWMHSGTSATLLLRAKENLPYADLSAYMGACLIKDYRDEGGWGAQGLDWIVENGLPDSKFWPQRSVSRSNDTPEMRANAKLHRVAEAWNDLSMPQYDRNLTFDQLATCLLCRIPVVVDFNWWSHSVCAVDLVETEPGSFGVRIWNSWGDSWSQAGMGLLSGSKAIPDGACAPRVSTPSPAWSSQPARKTA